MTNSHPQYTDDLPPSRGPRAPREFGTPALIGIQDDRQKAEAVTEIQDAIREFGYRKWQQMRRERGR